MSQWVMRRWPPDPSWPSRSTREDIQDLLGDRFTEIATICFVGFDLPSILDAFSDQAAGTFVSEPYWRQDCDVAEVRVLPITTIHNHYHLNFEDPDIDCIVPDPETLKMGRDEDGECVELDDYAAEPRMLGTMGGDEIIRIRAHDPSTGDPIPFDVASFANVSDEPVRFRYETEAGQWFEWNSLGGPTNWGVSVFDAVDEYPNDLPNHARSAIANMTRLTLFSSAPPTFGLPLDL